MQQTINYATLGSILDDIQNQCNQSPAFELFNREKIKRFYSQNAMRIKVFTEKRQSIFTDHVKQDEKGEVFLTTEVDGKKQWDFIDDDHKQKFEEETLAFTNISFTINL